jgi:hypothetical protein
LVNNAISTVLDGLVALLSRILVLLMGFTLPVVNPKGTKDVCNLVADNGLTTVTNEFQGGTMLDDFVLQCVTKLFIRLNPINISDFSVDSS